jgi:hypothetical protein
MSQYSIYRIDHFDPVDMGLKIRRQFIIYAILAPVIVLVFAICLMVLKIEILIKVFIPILILVFTYLFYRLGLKIRKLKVIGKIEFTKTGINKSVGDLSMSYDYQIIKKLELKKHIPIAGISGGLSDNFTYILRIIFSNSTKESIVVSNLPADQKLNINIVQTLNTLSRITNTEISIET